MPHRGLKKCSVVWWTLSCHQHKKPGGDGVGPLASGWPDFIDCTLSVEITQVACYRCLSIHLDDLFSWNDHAACWPCLISSTAKAAFLYTDCGCKLESLKVTGRTEKLLLQAIYGQTVLKQGFFVLFFAGPATHPSLWVRALTFWQKLQSPKMQTEQLQIFICTHLKILNGSSGRRGRAICYLRLYGVCNSITMSCLLWMCAVLLIFALCAMSNVQYVSVSILF